MIVNERGTAVRLLLAAVLEVRDHATQELLANTHIQLFAMDDHDYQPCTLQSGAKQDLTYYFLLPPQLNDGYLTTWSNYRQEWVEDDSVYMCFVAYDFKHLGPPTINYRNFHTPLIPIGPDDLEALAKMTQPFDDVLQNPTWSGAEEYWGYGPTIDDDGPAPYAVAKFETCYPPEKVTLRIANRQNIEEISYGIGNAYEEEDVQAAGCSGWDDPFIIHYQNPPVVFLEGSQDPHFYLHTDDPQDKVIRLIGYEYKALGGAATSFTLGWDGRQWMWNLGPHIPTGEALGLPYYPPGRYSLELELEFEGLAEPVTLEAGTVDLVYGGSLMDPSLEVADELRPLKANYSNVGIESPLYSVHTKGNPPHHYSFSLQTAVASALYSPIFHCDGHNNIWFFENIYGPLLKDLVYNGGCDSFHDCGTREYFVGDDPPDTMRTRVYMGWLVDVNSYASAEWDRLFYDLLFGRKWPFGPRYTIREAWDGANEKAKKINNKRYMRGNRLPIATGVDYKEKAPGDFDRTVDEFEKTVE